MWAPSEDKHSFEYRIEMCAGLKVDTHWHFWNEDDFEVDFEVDFDAPQFAPWSNVLELLNNNEVGQLIDEGLVTKQRNKLSVSSKYPFIIRKIASCYDQYLAEPKRAYSKVA